MLEQTKNTAPKPASLWNLLYRGELIVTGQPYPVSVAKKNQLINAGTHTATHFAIVRYSKKMI